jgi:Mor family transcriptional regulator
MPKVTESIVCVIRDFYSYQGKSIKEIAEKTELSETTVRNVIDREAMCDKEELITFSYCIQYLIKIGKISDKKKADGKTYYFDLTDLEIKIIESEYIPQFTLAKDKKELQEHYRKLAESGIPL